MKTKLESFRPAKTVFVVDDDETTLLLAEAVLKQEGFRVQTFSDARIALQAVLKDRPNVVVLDVLMPELDGFEFCREMRRHRVCEEIPVLVVTSLEDAESIDHAFRSGATDFATKPINWAIMTQRLRYMLRASDVAIKLRQERKQTLMAKEEWEKTFDSINDVVTVLDLDLGIRQCNSAAAATAGLLAEDMIGRTCFDVFQGRETPCQDCPVIHTIRSGTSKSREMTYRKPGGICHIAASPVRDSAGRLIRVVHVARDLREQKQLEAEYRRAQKMEAVGTLAGGIAHEFRNQLQIIRSHAELLGVDTHQADQDREAVQAIKNAVVRSSELTGQLLTFSRRNTSPEVRGPIDLNQLMNGFRTMIGRILPKTVSQEFILDRELRRVYAHAGQIEQVLMNLTVNAAQAMPEGGSLTIETKNAEADPDGRFRPASGRLEDYVMLRVCDTGRGMDKTTLDRIYEPFFSTKGVGEGTGLGLSVVFGIVEEHSGCIHCESEPGMGTVFRIYLRSSDKSAAKPQRQPTKEPGSFRGTETVMVVDDEPALRMAVERFLECTGYSVISVPDGETALRRFTQDPHRPDLVIMDLGMPGMGGWKCLERLRGLDPTLKVILATGYVEEELAERAARMGACQLIRKPFILKELTASIRQVLDSEKHLVK